MCSGISGPSYSAWSTLRGRSSRRSSRRSRDHLRSPGFSSGRPRPPPRRSVGLRSPGLRSEKPRSSRRSLDFPEVRRCAPPEREEPSCPDELVRRGRELSAMTNPFGDCAQLGQHTGGQSSKGHPREGVAFTEVLSGDVLLSNNLPDRKRVASGKSVSE